MTISAGLLDCFSLFCTYIEYLKKTVQLSQNTTDEANQWTVIKKTDTHILCNGIENSLTVWLHTSESLSAIQRVFLTNDQVIWSDTSVWLSGWQVEIIQVEYFVFINVFFGLDRRQNALMRWWFVSTALWLENLHETYSPPPVKYCSFITPEEWNIQNLTSAISARRETERSAQSTTITTRPSRYLTEMEGRRDEGGQTQRGKRGECDDKWAVACGSSALIMVSGWKNTQAPHRLLGDNGILRASDTAKDRDEIWK